MNRNKNCYICEEELNEITWSEGKQKKGWYVCNKCHSDKYRRYKKLNPFKAKLSYYNKRYGAVLTVDNLDMMWEMQQGKCNICDDVLTKTGTYCIDHIIPRAKAGLNELSNFQITCEKCNVGKHDYSLEEYVQHCLKVTNNWKNKKNELN